MTIENPMVTNFCQVITGNLMYQTYFEVFHSLLAEWACNH